jgi:heat shock protein HslJ
MKTALQIIAILSVFFLSNSCKNDHDSDPEQFYSTWEAKSFMSIESVAYPKNENKPILLTFKSDGSYELKLDINRGWGTFTLNVDNQIKFGVAAITEACCDSKFSEKLVMMISMVTTYSIEGNTLKLNVPQWGSIELEWVK